MKVSIFGLGYVGAVSCACLPELGHAVIGVDTNPSKVRMINDGQSPVVEDGIDELIGAAVRGGKLRATDDVESAVLASEISLISVATPSNPHQTSRQQRRLHRQLSAHRHELSECRRKTQPTSTSPSLLARSGSSSQAGFSARLQ